jgi:hypothetical protein
VKTNGMQIGEHGIENCFMNMMLILVFKRHILEKTSFLVF